MPSPSRKYKTESKSKSKSTQVIPMFFKNKFISNKIRGRSNRSRSHSNYKVQERNRTSRKRITKSI